MTNAVDLDVPFLPLFPVPDFLWARHLFLRKPITLPIHCRFPSGKSKMSIFMAFKRSSVRSRYPPLHNPLQNKGLCRFLEVDRWWGCGGGAMLVPCRNENRGCDGLEPIFLIPCARQCSKSPGRADCLGEVVIKWGDPGPHDPPARQSAVKNPVGGGRALRPLK